MTVPSVITDLNVVAASNSPAGTDPVGSTLDDFLRAGFAIVRREQAQGAAIASASTTNIGGNTDGYYLHITGTTTITSFGTVAAGVSRVVVFDAALTLTYNATSLILPGLANITTAAGDVAEFVSEGSGNWRCTRYIPIGMSPASGASYNIYGLTGISNAATPTTKFDVTASRVTTLDALGRARVYSSVGAKTVDISVQGLGGRDQASAFSANAKVNLFYVPDGSGGLSIVASGNTFATGPTGYTEFCPIMSHKLNGGSQFQQGILRGKDFFLNGTVNLVSSSVSSFPTAASYSLLIPADEAMEIFVVSNATIVGGSSGQGSAVMNLSGTTSTQQFPTIIVGPSVSNSLPISMIRLPVNAATSVYYGQAGGTNISSYSQNVTIHGWQSGG
jgi:hypothetical protein